MTRPRLAVHLGAALVRLTGAAAGVLTAVLLVVGAIGLLAFEPVDEAVCDYDAARDECAGREWITFAVLGVGSLAFVLGLLLLPTWLMHLTHRRRLRREELLAAPRLQALDSWRMAGQVPAPVHQDLRQRLRTLSRLEHPAQVARAAGALLASLCGMLLVLAAAGAAVASVVVADRGYCEDAPDACAWATAGAGLAGTLVLVAVLGLVAGLAAVAAGRRDERSERSRFEVDWDRAVLQGAQAARPAPRRAG